MLAAVVALGLLGRLGGPAAAQVNSAAGGHGAPGHFNVGEAHSPRLLRALAGAPVQGTEPIPGVSVVSRHPGAGIGV